jgi:hypothetical protein
MIYLEAASNLYHVLTEDGTGVSFLSSDRRGLLFTEISQEIEALIENSHRQSNNQAVKNVFRAWSCSYTMSREYITLLGRLTTTLGGRKFIEETKVFHHLSSLANYKNLEYLSRLSVTSLSFTDGGYLSKHFLQLWACSSSCAMDFKSFMYSILLVVLLSRPHDFMEWGLDVFVSFLSNEDSSVQLLYDILALITENKHLLRQLLLRKLSPLDYKFFRPLLMRFACVSEGVSYLQDTKYLNSEMEYWGSSGVMEYAKDIDRRLASAFDHVNDSLRNANNTSSETSCTIPVIVSAYAPYSLMQGPVFIKTTETSDNERREVSDSTMSAFGASSGIGHIMSQSVSSEQQQQSLQDGTDCDSASLELEGLLRAPWNIEVKLSNGLLPQSSGEYLTVDTYLDISDLRQPLAADVISDQNRTVTVRGIVLDAKGFPSAIPIAISRSISSTLMIGVSPVYRDGSVHTSFDPKIIRRRSNTTSAATTTTTAREAGRRSSVTSPTFEDPDIPVTSQNESYYDWSVLKPMHRQNGIITELKDNSFSIEIPGDPAMFIFTRTAPFAAPSPAVSNVSNSRRKSEVGGLPPTFTTVNKTETSTTSKGSSGFIYLKEVQYRLQLRTSQVFFELPKLITL